MKFSKGTKVIAGFPGVGKSFFTNNNSEFTCKDSDSSEFSWLDSGERNPNFVSDYINHIDASFKSGKYDYVFISTHELILSNMPEHIVESLYMVVPDKSLKSTYLERYECRGSPKSFIDLISNNWDNFIDDVVQNENCAGCFTLKDPDETLVNVIRYIESNTLD